MADTMSTPQPPASASPLPRHVIAPLQKSNSHTSIRATGTHPVGSLHVHDLASPPTSTFLVVLDVPQNFAIGFDTVSFTNTTAPFRGLREISSGPHFLWVSESEAGLATRSGVWFVASSDPQETVVVVQWDAFNGVLCRASLAEERIQKADVQANPDRANEQLLPYPELVRQSSLQVLQQQQKSLEMLVKSRPVEDRLQAWRSLSGNVSPALLSRVTGSPEAPWQVQTTDRVWGAHMLASEIELDNQLATAFPGGTLAASSLTATQELRFAFSQTERTFDTAAMGAELTAAALDSTAHIISRMRDAELSEADVIGEMQLAFIVGAHLGNEACVRQWRHFVLKVVLRAFGLVEENPTLAAELLSAIAAQLRHAEATLSSAADLGLEAGGLAASHMQTALAVYKRRLDGFFVVLGQDVSPDQMRVGTAFQSIEAAALRLGWDLRSSGGYGAGKEDDVLRKGTVTLEDGEQVELEMERTREEDEENEEGEYAPAMVDLDDEGRELGRVSWD
jgi:A1 cistron-splicing factor AAR2